MDFLPPVPGFESSVAAVLRSAARLYRVTADVELLCCWIEEGIPGLPVDPGPPGCYLYAFLRRGRELGRWAYSPDFGDVRGAMERFRAAGEVRPPEQAPGGEPADLGRAREALFSLGGKPVPSHTWLRLRSTDPVDGPSGIA